MDDRHITSLYRWEPGSCFRCARTDLDTTRISEINTRAGVKYDVRACRDCILELEAEQQRRAERAGREYVPGTLPRCEGRDGGTA